jgi:hypothetical protein
MDAETQKIYDEGEKYFQLVTSKGWLLVKEQIFTPGLLDLQSVQNIKHSSVTDMAREVYARQLACEYVMAMLKDIEGRAQQHIDNQSLTQDTVQVI